MASNRKRTRKRRAAAQPAEADPVPNRPPSAAHPFPRAPLVVAGLVGAVAFVVYALTVEPGVPTGDSGELITSAYVLGIPHPPGYPLYMLLGHLAMLLPAGSPALRMNLLSGVLDAVAVSLVFTVVYRLLTGSPGSSRIGGKEWAAPLAGAVAALLLAFSPLFWAYSVVAEVFALNNLFAVSLLLIAFEWLRRPERVRLLWLWMFVFGLALCDQQTVALLLPGFVVCLWQGLRVGAGRGFRLSRRALAISVVALVAGLAPYLYLPLAARGGPVMNWGNPDSFGRFIADVDRHDYGLLSLVAGGTRGSIVQNLKLVFSDLTRGFLYVGVLLAATGLCAAWRYWRAEGLALAASFLASGPAFLAVTDTGYPTELTKGIVARFYILPSIPLAIAAGLGAAWLLAGAARVRLRWIPSRIAAAAVGAALLAAPAASAVVHYADADERGNYVAEAYGEDLLATLAPDAVLLMRGDQNETAVSYVQNVLRYRTDVIALDTELLKLPSYVSQQRRLHPGLEIPWSAFDGGLHTSLNTLVSANLPHHPVYVIGGQEERDFGRPFESVEAGLARQLLPRGAEPSAYSLLVADPSRYAELRFPTRRYPASTWEGAAIEPAYAEAAFALGYALDTAGSRAELPLAERMYRIAILLEPDSPDSYRNLALLLHREGGDPGEVVSLLTSYLRLDPRDPQAGVLRRLEDSLEATLRRR